MSRGQLTTEIELKALELLDINGLTRDEFRLMPYLQYTLMNTKRFNPERLNGSDRNILSDWRKLGWLRGGVGSEVSVTKEFWDAMNEILWLGYAKGEGQ